MYIYLSHIVVISIDKVKTIRGSSYYLSYCKSCEYMLYFGYCECTTKLVSRLLMKTCHKNGLQSATKEMDSEVRRPHKCTYHVWYSRKPLPQACQRFWLYMCKNTDLNGILKTSLTIEQGLLALTLVGNLSLEEKLFCDMVITQQFFPSSCQLFNSFQVCDIGAQMYSLMLGECLTF